MSANAKVTADTTIGVHPFTVISNDEVAVGIWKLELRSPVAAQLEPGKFMNFQVPGDTAQILRIPLSFARADADSGVVDVYYAVVGDGTRRLSQMETWESSTLVGPLGNGWSLPQGDGRCLLIAGGIGLPPVFAAAEMLSRAGIGFDIVIGAKTASMHVDPLIDELRCLPLADGDDYLTRVTICTDNGSRGVKGFTTDAMANLLNTHTYSCVYTCGPTVMMAGVARLAAEYDIPCQASLERMMGCGFGACSCCNVALVRGGYALCCTDGPVFDAAEVVW